MTAAAPPRDPDAAGPAPAASASLSDGDRLCDRPGDRAADGAADRPVATLGEGPDDRPGEHGRDPGAAPEAGGSGDLALPPPAAGVRRLVIIQKRRDFVLAANRGQRLGLPGLNLQARPRRGDEPADPAEARIGYTCSKKVGGAVQRNRAKRRLRAAAAQALPGLARPGWDYVLIGRRDATAERPFLELVADLAEGVARLHARVDRGPRDRKPEDGTQREAKDRSRQSGKGAGKNAGADQAEARGRPKSRR